MEQFWVLASCNCCFVEASSVQQLKSVQGPISCLMVFESKNGADSLRCKQMCSAIPHGKVSTYGAMAVALQSSPRAVGQVISCVPKKEKELVWLHDMSGLP